MDQEATPTNQPQASPPDTQSTLTRAIEAEYDDDDQSYATFSDRDGEERAEGDEEYSDDDEGDRDLPSSFLPPNAFGSRRLPPSRLSRASQASFPRQWTRRPSGSTRSHRPNHEGDLSGGPNSPSSLSGPHTKPWKGPLPPKVLN
ncbi:hypothetical protein KEM48_002958 [Puccinia striiformis f. sp. tritici PST-130]|nr:hypothetical protein KEM48_002958 [Puccinia striiformis f. sp. tritici PST-130]